MRSKLLKVCFGFFTSFFTPFRPAPVWILLSDSTWRMVTTCGTENFQQTNSVRTTSSFLIPFWIIQYIFLCIYNYIYVDMVLMHNARWISAILAMNMSTKMWLKVKVKLTEWHSCHHLVILSDLDGTNSSCDVS